jgi:hypothetical protein
MSEGAASGGHPGAGLPYHRRKTALVLCENISRRLEVRRSLEAQGYFVACRRGARDLATCKRVYMPELVVVDGAWLARRPGIYGVLERLGRQARVEVVDAGRTRLPRHAHASPGHDRG